MKYNINKLLSEGTTNAKTKKNGYKTFILYLAPHIQNSKGINICPKASKGCAAACLFSAGRGKFNSVKEARTRKTEFYLNDKEGFILQLAKEIVTKHKTAVKRGETILFRLNGTSDLDFVYLLKKYAALDVATLQNAIFYDYTKILGKALKYKNHKKYVVTFSRAEDNEKDAFTALQNGINVSAVFSDDLPNYFSYQIKDGAKHIYKVVDGDQSDNMMLYNRGVILGLTAKGDAKKDKSGFVIPSSNKIECIKTIEKNLISNTI